jgi:cytoskeletal protein RodZ
MQTFGEKLRAVLESRGLTPDVVSAATGITVDRIRALERDDYGAVPDNEALAQGLRALARLAHVDPEQVLADYRRERERSAGPTQDAGDAVSAAGPPPRRWAGSPGSSAHPRLRQRRFVMAAAAVFAVVLVGFLFRSATGRHVEPGRMAGFRGVTSSSPPPKAAAPAPGFAGDTLPSSHGAETPVPEPSGPAPEADDLPEDVPAAGVQGLSIPEHGVGRGVAGQKLTGETDRFQAGERAWFWTRVEGGAAGDWISHVWIHEGHEVLRVPLEIGGGRWRTKSRKDLVHGATGRWVVEARDESNRVLARSEFLVTH